MRGPFWSQTINDEEVRHLLGDDEDGYVDARRLEEAKERHPANQGAAPSPEDVFAGPAA